MAALQYVDIPGYAAILFRRTYADLSLPGALLDRARDWLTGTNAHWKDQEKTWIFRTRAEPATLSFGYLESEDNKYRYQSAEFQMVGFDELTQFTESQYTYLFSRLRRLEGSNIPIRMRAASNPGDKGHQWVKQRFIIEGHQNSRPFIPAKLEDNPYLDKIAYSKSLMKLDPVTRAQLRSGDWDVLAGGNKFKPSWFPIVDVAPADCKWVRFWDLAATEPKPGGDPDWTAGALVGKTAAGIYYVKDIRRVRESPLGVQNLVLQTAELDGKEVSIFMEQEPGSSGVNTIDHYRREVLQRFAFYGRRSTGAKEVRANPVSSQSEAGNIKLVSGAWINPFLEEAEQFPNGAHDDQVDALSGAYEELNNSSFSVWNSVLKKKIEAQKEAQNG